MYNLVRVLSESKRIFTLFCRILYRDQLNSKRVSFRNFMAVGMKIERLQRFLLGDAIVRLSVEQYFRHKISYVLFKIFVPMASLSKICAWRMASAVGSCSTLVSCPSVLSISHTPALCQGSR